MYIDLQLKNKVYKDTLCVNSYRIDLPRIQIYIVIVLCYYIYVLYIDIDKFLFF